MKKTLKYLSIFIFTLMVCVFFSITARNNVKAYEVNCSTGLDMRDEKFDNGCDIKESSYGNINISSKGTISVTYKYGITELLIYALPYDEKDVSIPTEAKIIHSSGYVNLPYIAKKSVVDKDSLSDNVEIITTWSDYYVLSKKVGSFSINIAKYFDESKLEKYSKIAINLVYEFKTKRIEYSFGDPLKYDYTGDYTMSYCSVNISGCNTKSRRSNGGVTDRINDFIKENTSISKAITTIETTDARNIVYAYKNEYNTNNTSSTYSSYYDTSKNNVFKITEIYVKAEDESFDSANKELSEIITDTVIPTLMGILGLAAAVSIIVLGYKIVKGADEPEERSKNIKLLKSILIGIAIAFIALALTKPLMSLFESQVE